MRAGIYARVSSEEQARHGFSIGYQIELAEERARKLGVKQIHIFRDEGVPGSLLIRPALERLMDFVRDNKIDIVICYDPDRLARQLSHQLLITDEIEKRGVKLEFVNFEWKNTPEGQLFYAMRGAIAEYEKEKIRERTRNGRLRKARQGKLPGYFHTYGYNYDKEQQMMYPEPFEASVVKLIFEMFVQENRGINGIAKKLTELGIPTKKGKNKWHRQVVRQILMNPVYIGKQRYNTTDCTDYGLNKYKPKDERISIKPRPKEEWVIIPVPPIIEEDLYNAAQEKLRNSRRLWAGKKTGFKQYLLSGLVCCGDCNNTMTGIYQNNWGRKKRYYTCYKSYAGNKNSGCKPIKRIQAEVLEDLVWKNVCSWINNPVDLFAELIDLVDSSLYYGREVSRLGENLERAQKGREDILRLVASNTISYEEAKRSLDELSKKIKGLKNKINQLQEHLHSLQISGKNKEFLYTVAERHLKNLSDYDFEHRQAIVRILIERIVVCNRRPEFEIIIEANVPEIGRKDE